MLKCKDNYYFIENTTNCMTKKQMENYNYYFDYNKIIFRQCPNGCSTCDNEKYYIKCAENYHFIYNETGRCILELNKGDFLCSANKSNIYKKFMRGLQLMYL